MEEQQENDVDVAELKKIFKILMEADEVEEAADAAAAPPSTPPPHSAPTAIANNKKFSHQSDKRQWTIQNENKDDDFDNEDDDNYDNLGYQLRYMGYNVDNYDDEEDENDEMAKQQQPRQNLVDADYDDDYAHFDEFIGAI